MKKIFSVFLASLLFVAAFLTPSAGAATVKEDYVALGDSIAAGQTPYKTIGTGYTDMIADELDNQEALASFTKSYATPGETSTGLLTKLQRSDVQAAVKNAELVTISSGANDLLAFVNTGSNDPLKALEVVNKVNQNLTASIQKIKSLNKNADIYLFGYYFPYSSMEEGTKKENLTIAFNYFNSELESTAKAQGVTFIDVSSSFKAEYLPNANDVHPNEAGYKVFADQFFKVWKNSTIPDPEQGKDPFTDISKLGSQARIAIMKLAEAGIINGNIDGTFAPKSNITRAETAIILSRALGKTGTAPNPGFSDVSSKMKSYAAIAKLTEAGVFAKAPKFNPDKPLTRAQMARVLTQSLNLQAGASSIFNDVPAKHWANEEINAVYSHGIMSGGANAMFYPENNITREQFAITMYNVWSHSFIGTP
ncbi:MULTISPECIES: S-layer homology domain-containing protein [Bacillaceae]|uniref:SLH domain-containing protein n=1 Tax=Domibacillus aminovorans TaxID=29332 RepID=A0A177KMG6_9BACI|nr:MULTISPECIES: S-layer homology domain-containing protein [Bacillaceae]OAH54563.1 hypothetical protein AWH48_08185 [Domibacillus aminovorans]